MRIGLRTDEAGANPDACRLPTPQVQWLAEAEAVITQSPLRGQYQVFADFPGSAPVVWCRRPGATMSGIVGI